MTNEKVLAIVREYQLLFELLGIPASPCNRSARHLDMETKLAHCHWMTNQVPGFLQDGRTEKAMRWLGNIQGIFWAMGFMSIDNLINQSKPEHRS